MPGNSEELSITFNSAMLTNVLDALKSFPNSPLRHVTLQTGIKHYSGPVLDPSLTSKLAPHEAPFREDYPRLPYPHFYYELEELIADRSSNSSFTYSIHHPSLIIGASSQSPYNLMFGLSVYASICKHEVLPFRYRGNRYTWEHFFDMPDSRVIAEQHIWAAVKDKAKNQAFNFTNGDVSMKSFWRVLCNVFHLEFLPSDDEKKFELSKFIKNKRKVWDEIGEKYGLIKTKIEEHPFEAVDIFLHFEFQYVCSMNKSREFGFFGYADTLKNVGFWVERQRFKSDSMIHLTRGQRGHLFRWSGTRIHLSCNS